MKAIPNKLYFRIGEVSTIVGVKPYVLRYWESEFPDVRPAKSKSGQRLYKRRDVESLLRIKTLLYEERFTINGARKRLKESSKDTATDGHNREDEQQDAFEARASRSSKSKGAAPHEGRKVLLKVRKDLESLLKIIRD